MLSVQETLFTLPQLIGGLGVASGGGVLGSGSGSRSADELGVGTACGFLSPHSIDSFWLPETSFPQFLQDERGLVNSNFDFWIAEIK